MRRQVAAGVMAEVIESRVAGSYVMVGLTLSAPEGVLPDDLPRDQPAYKVITTRAGRVLHIQDCVDRSHAAGLAGVV